MPLAFSGIWKPNKIKHHYFGNWLILVGIPQIKSPSLCLRASRLSSAKTLTSLSCNFLFTSGIFIAVLRCWQQGLGLAHCPPPSVWSLHRACAPKLLVKWVDESSCIPSLKVGKWRLRLKRFKVRAWEGFVFRRLFLFIHLRRSPHCVSA